MFLRPHETFHEPNRKFFHNELFRFPTFESYPLEQVGGKCFVMDLNTFCKGNEYMFVNSIFFLLVLEKIKKNSIYTKL